MGWTVANMPDLTGKRVLITGANSGIGYFAAVELARHGATVLLACRDPQRGAAALERLRLEVPAAQARLVQLDLASLRSVQAAADAELAHGLPLDCLLNNAGIMATPRRKETEDGLELQFGTNVVGHFALTGRLLPALKLATAARVVTVSSIAHKRGRIHFEDLQSLSRYSPTGAYYQSKLADLMFALELERRLRAAGTRILSVGVHPGVARTTLFKVGSGKGLARLAEQVIQATIGLLMNSDVDGALPTVYAACAPDVQGGGYYGPQGFLETRGGDVGPAKIASQALDREAQVRLWQMCEALSGVRFL